MSEATYIRSNHWAAFRSGQWARILTIAPAPAEEQEEPTGDFGRLVKALGAKRRPRSRDCYVVEFPDGKTDWWVVDDPAAEYEFSASPPPERKTNE